MPWILLGRRTAYQPALGTSPAELVYGSTIRIPGELAGADLEKDSDLPHLLERVRAKAARPPVQTSHHTTPAVNLPPATDTCTHVWVKKGKPTPLGAAFDGPYRIEERQGTSCLKVRAGSYVNGTPRYEVHHLANCKPTEFAGDPFEA